MTCRPGECWSAECPLPPPGAKILPHPNGVVAAPGAIGTKVRRSQEPVAGTETVEEKMLGNAHFEAPSHVDGGSPGMLETDGIERPGVETLRHVLAEQKTWLSKKHETAEGATTEGADLHQARKHVAGEGITRCIRAAIVTRIGGAEIGIDFIVRRGEVELRPAPESVCRKEHPLVWTCARHLRL